MGVPGFRSSKSPTRFRSQGMGHLRWENLPIATLWNSIETKNQLAFREFVFWNFRCWFWWSYQTCIGCKNSEWNRNDIQLTIIQYVFVKYAINITPEDPETFAKNNIVPNQPPCVSSFDSARHPPCRSSIWAMTDQWKTCFFFSGYNRLSESFQVPVFLFLPRTKAFELTCAMSWTCEIINFVRCLKHPTASRLFWATWFVTTFPCVVLVVPSCLPHIDTNLRKRPTPGNF